MLSWLANNVEAQRPLVREDSVFIVIRKYTVQRGAGAVWAQRVRDGFVPLLRQMPGFVNYHLMETGPDAIATITIYENAHEALASSELAAEWVRDNVMELMRGVPDYTVGEALITESAAG
jgi:Antibiotic biosynthesis monooxygenase